MSTAAAEIITATGLDIRPLQPTIGAEIHGIDIGKPPMAVPGRYKKPFLPQGGQRA